MLIGCRRHKTSVPSKHTDGLQSFLSPENLITSSLGISCVDGIHWNDDTFLSEQKFYILWQVKRNRVERAVQPETWMALLWIHAFSIGYTQTVYPEEWFQNTFKLQYKVSSESHWARIQSMFGGLVCFKSKILFQNKMGRWSNILIHLEKSPLIKRG